MHHAVRTFKVIVGAMTVAPVWCPNAVAEALMQAFPNLEMIGLNLQVSFQEDASMFEAVCTLLSVLVSKNVNIKSYEVYLVMLPKSRRKRDSFMNMMTDRLFRIGVKFTQFIRARTRRGVPVDGFRLPAVLHMSLPSCVRKAVDRALWY